MLWANCQGAGMHPILFARITALSAPGLKNCQGEPGNLEASATSELDSLFINWHVYCINYCNVEQQNYYLKRDSI